MQRQRIMEMRGVFNAATVARVLLITDSHARVLISQLYSMKLLRRVRRGYYEVRND